MPSRGSFSTGLPSRQPRPGPARRRDRGGGQDSGRCGTGASSARGPARPDAASSGAGAAGAVARAGPVASSRRSARSAVMAMTGPPPAGAVSPAPGHASQAARTADRSVGSSAPTARAAQPVRPAGPRPARAGRGRPGVGDAPARSGAGRPPASCQRACERADGSRPSCAAWRSSWPIRSSGWTQVSRRAVIDQPSAGRTPSRGRGGVRRRGSKISRATSVSVAPGPCRSRRLASATVLGPVRAGPRSRRPGRRRGHRPSWRSSRSRGRS